MPSFVNNSSHFFHIDASSPRPCTNSTGDDGFPPAIFVPGGRLTNEAKAATPKAIATTATAIMITVFLLTNFLFAGSLRLHLILRLYDLVLMVKFIKFYGC